jgi:preprotein translocase subunit SecD
VLVERSKVPGEEIVVRIPATLDAAKVKEVIVEPGRLALKLVAQNTQIPFPSREAAETALKTFNSPAFEILPYKERYKEDGGMSGFVIVEKKAVITSMDLRDARAITSQYNSSNYQIDFSLTPEGAVRISKATGEHVGDYLAIVLNNEVKSAPRIDGQINDRGQITGNFTRLEAEKWLSHSAPASCRMRFPLSVKK